MLQSLRYGPVKRHGRAKLNDFFTEFRVLPA
jgi:hypothetical protein